MTSGDNTYFTYATPHGPITLRATPRGIAEVVFGQVELAGTHAASAATNAAANELQEYFAGKRCEFDVAIDMQGSAFQRSVWAETMAIPYGETRSPAQIAESIGKPGSHRSVGAAVRQCRLAPLVPTHRVSAPNATGKTAKIMRALAALERKALNR